MALRAGSEGRNVRSSADRRHDGVLDEHKEDHADKAEPLAAPLAKIVKQDPDGRTPDLADQRFGRG